jgi:hypothetical protein
MKGDPMKKLQLMGAVFAVLFALGVLGASTALATVTFLLAEWLVNGASISSTQLVDAEGEILIEEELLGVKLDVLCSGIFDGNIGPNGAAEATELLSLGGVRVISALEETGGLECINDQNCPEPLVWPINLPWLGEVELMVDGTEEFFAGLGSAGGAAQAAYHIICMGSSLSDLCSSSEAIGQLTNEAGGTVDGEVAESFTELGGLKLANCEVAGNEKGILEGLGVILLTAGGSLSVSE